MKEKPLAIMRGLRIQIRNQDLLLILFPGQPLNETVGFQLISQIMSLQNQGIMVPVFAKPDETLTALAVSGRKEEIESRTIPVSQLVNIPFYKGDFEPPKDVA